MDEAAPDALMGGRLRVFQPPRGHRAGTDALLLAAAAASVDAATFVDVGAGVGTAGLVLAHLRPRVRGLLLEANADAADLARRNCALNALGDRVDVVEADLFAGAALRRAGLEREAAELVLTNPPFYRSGEVRTSPDEARASAHVLGEASHADWLRAAAALLAPKGRFVMIHRPEAVPTLLAAAEGRLGGVAIRPVYPRLDAEAVRVIVSGVKGSRAPVRILPGIVLHGQDGGFTPEAEAIHRGDASIPT